MNTNHAIQWLLQQALLLSAAIMATAALRALCLRWLGAAAAYQAWLIVPLLLLAAVLPPLPQAWGHFAPHLPTLPSLDAMPILGAGAAAAVRPDASAPWQPLLLGLWAAGALVFGLSLALRQWRFTRRLQRRPGQLHWTLPAGLSPALIGVWPARLGLPEDFEQRFSAPEQALILAHEAVHARRHDNAWNLLAHLLCAMHWFNPLAWWALARMRADQEIACDAAVLNSGASPAPTLYARALLKSHTDMPLPELVSMWRPSHPLIERVGQLARHQPLAARRRAGQTLVVATGLAAAALVYASQPPLGAVPLRPGKPLKAGHATLTYEARSRLDGGTSWRWEDSVQFPDRGPIRGARISWKEQAADGKPQWCVEIGAVASADQEMRLVGRLLDPGCKEFLAEPQALAQDGRAISRLTGRTAEGQHIAVELRARLDRSAP